MTEEGFTRRVYAIEWNMDLLVQNGCPLALCQKIRDYCCLCVEADFDDGDGSLPRPLTTDPALLSAMEYFDDLFTQESFMPSGKDHYFVPARKYFE